MGRNVYAEVVVDMLVGGLIGLIIYTVFCAIPVSVLSALYFWSSGDTGREAIQQAFIVGGGSGLLTVMVAALAGAILGSLRY